MNENQREPRRRAHVDWKPSRSRKREPSTKSASPASMGATSVATDAGSCCPSPSSRTMARYSRSSPHAMPAWTVAPIPQLNGSRRTDAPASLAIRAVSSNEPSSITRTSGASDSVRSSAMTCAMFAASFHAGMTASLGRAGRFDATRPVSGRSRSSPTACITSSGPPRMTRRGSVGPIGAFVEVGDNSAIW